MTENSPSTESKRQRFVALVRGINVGGNSVIKTAELRKLFESAGLVDVSTYIQSGNVLFSTDNADRRELTGTLDKNLAALLGNKVRAFIFSRDELVRAIANNPFHEEEPEIRRHLMFLSSRPDPSRVTTLMEMQGKEYKFHVKGNVLYYAYPVEFAGNRRNIDFERVLGVSGTSRNLSVVKKIIELLAD